MNKRICILTSLPVFLLGGCMSKNQITKDQAAEVAGNIIQRLPARYAGISEISVVSEYKERTPMAGVHDDKITVFEYSGESQLIYMSSEPTEEYATYSNVPMTKTWIFLSDDYFYYLNQVGAKKEGYKAYCRATNIFKQLGYFLGKKVTLSEFVHDNTNISFFDQTLKAIENCEDIKCEFEMDGPNPTITNSASYYSANNDNQLRVEFSSKLKDTTLAYYDVEGPANGEIKGTIIWEKGRPNSLEYSSSYKIRDTVREVNLFLSKSISTNIKYEGVNVKLPILSEFNIEEIYIEYGI